MSQTKVASSVERMNFNPEWMRSTFTPGGNAASRPQFSSSSSHVMLGDAMGPMAPPKLAHNRYGREEMLALCPCNLPADAGLPERCAEYFVERPLPPICYLPLSDTEQRLLTLGVNSSKVMNVINHAERIRTAPRAGVGRGDHPGTWEHRGRGYGGGVENHPPFGRGRGRGEGRGNIRGHPEEPFYRPGGRGAGGEEGGPERRPFGRLNEKESGPEAPANPRAQGLLEAERGVSDRPRWVTARSERTNSSSEGERSEFRHLSDRNRSTSSTDQIPEWMTEEISEQEAGTFDGGQFKATALEDDTIEDDEFVEAVSEQPMEESDDNNSTATPVNTAAAPGLHFKSPEPETTAPEIGSYKATVAAAGGGGNSSGSPDHDKQQQPVIMETSSGLRISVDTLFGAKMAQQSAAKVLPVDSGAANLAGSGAVFGTTAPPASSAAVGGQIMPPTNQFRLAGDHDSAQLTGTGTGTSPHTGSAHAVSGSLPVFQTFRAPPNQHSPPSQTFIRSLMMGRPGAGTGTQPRFRLPGAGDAGSGPLPITTAAVAVGHAGTPPSVYNIPPISKHYEAVVQSSSAQLAQPVAVAAHAHADPSSRSQFLSQAQVTSAALVAPEGFQTQNRPISVAALLSGGGVGVGGRSAGGGLPNDETFANIHRDAESLVNSFAEEDSSKANALEKWFYKDPQGKVQGPFESSQMFAWFASGYFTMTLLVKRASDRAFVELGELIRQKCCIPFAPPCQKEPGSGRGGEGGTVNGKTSSSHYVAQTPIEKEAHARMQHMLSTYTGPSTAQQNSALPQAPSTNHIVQQTPSAHARDAAPMISANHVTAIGMRGEQTKSASPMKSVWGEEEVPASIRSGPGPLNELQQARKSLEEKQKLLEQMDYVVRQEKARELLEQQRQRERSEMLAQKKAEEERRLEEQRKSRAEQERLAQEQRMAELAKKQEEQRRAREEEERRKREEEERKLREKEEAELRRLEDIERRKREAEELKRQRREADEQRKLQKDEEERQRQERMRKHVEEIKRKEMEEETMKQRAWLRAFPDEEIKQSWSAPQAKTEGRVMSLAEIQAEEERQIKAEQREVTHLQTSVQVKPPSPVKPVSQGVWNKPLSANAWGGAAHDAFPDVQASRGFWDGSDNEDPPLPEKIISNARSPAKTKAKKNNSEHNRAQNHKIEQPASNKKSWNMFTLPSPSEEFTSWCCREIEKFDAELDGTTFATFLYALDSADEIRDYVQSYLGDGRQVKEFAAAFVARRNQASAKRQETNQNVASKPQQQPQSGKERHGNNGGKKANAAPKQPQPQHQEATDSSGGAKKKKKKAAKIVDGSVLGFTAVADSKRLNAGELDMGS